MKAPCEGSSRICLGVKIVTWEFCCVQLKHGNKVYRERSKDTGPAGRKRTRCPRSDIQLVEGAMEELGASEWPCTRWSWLIEHNKVGVWSGLDPCPIVLALSVVLTHNMYQPITICYCACPSPRWY